MEDAFFFVFFRFRSKTCYLLLFPGVCWGDIFFCELGTNRERKFDWMAKRDDEVKVSFFPRSVPPSVAHRFLFWGGAGEESVKIAS